MVENNTIDLGVVEAKVTNKNLVVDVCRVDHLVAILPPGHELADKKMVNFEELTRFPFICREEGSGTREVIGDYLAMQDNACNLKIAMELGSPEAVKGAVEAGMGLSIVSRATIQKELRLGTLVAVNLDPPLQRPFSFVHPKQKFRLRVMEELLDFAQMYCQDFKDPAKD